MLCNSYSPIPFLTCLYVPSLESVDIDTTEAVYLNTNIAVYEMIDAIGGDDVLRLRYFHLNHNEFLLGSKVTAMLRRLDCLHTLVLSHMIIPLNPRITTILGALSPHNRDFRSACPQLATVILIDSRVTEEAFVNFVHLRVQSDSEEPTPGLVGCLKLARVSCINDDLWTSLAKTHGKSIHKLPFDFDLGGEIDFG